MKKKVYTFTKEHTSIAKGVAIVLMIIHHLFRVPERIQNVSYISVVPFWKINFEYWFADFGKICVAIYFLLSGYGLYVIYTKKQQFTFKDSIQRVFNFLINYWVVFVIFIPVGLIWFESNSRYHWDLKIFLENFFILRNSYSDEWWVVKVYIELVLIFPIVKYIVKKSTIGSFVLSLFLYFVSIYPSLLNNIIFQPLHIKNELLIADITNLMYWQIVFCTGALIAKLDFFKAANKFLDRIRISNKFICIIGILIIAFIRIVVSREFILIGRAYSTYIDFIIAPFFILFCTNLIFSTKFKKVFLVLGKHSTNIWLTHTFFAYHYYQKLVFMPKLSVLIVIWLLILSLASSIVINYIIAGFYNLGSMVESVSKRKSIYEQ
ncbi:acyltransferase family protein [Clostridium cellulovorans]|nr:acyltransferase [Clostridium cellulovorans]